MDRSWNRERCHVDRGTADEDTADRGLWQSKRGEKENVLLFLLNKKATTHAVI
jgi:hypothetical protein